MAYEPGLATVTVGIWAKKSGAWQKVSSDYVYVNGSYSAAAVVRSFLVDKSFQLGSGVEAFGLTIDAVDGGTAPSLTDFISVIWTAPGTPSSTRTATPSGRTSKVTVRPQ